MFSLVDGYVNCALTSTAAKIYNKVHVSVSIRIKLALGCSVVVERASIEPFISTFNKGR